MKTTILALVLLFSSSILLAQSPYFIKGSVADTASGSKMHNTSVSVLYAKDSILVKFTRATANGTFAISNLKKGKYLLLITYPGYADYVERFALDSVNQTHDFGKINMTLKSKLLRDVIIKGQVAAIKIKGDTTEFNAGSFKVQPNAKVEDLLKQLPGIQVDKDGKITAQGETVNKVLVDGEEFFGDDPTLVTKNVRADMVDKVQLYDKKSDQAAFTGIDDGQKSKTINIKLKEDKKNGYFGKLDAGAGTDGYYQVQGMYNRFKAKQKFSVYGITANTGKVGLGWEDNDKYGGSNNVQFSDDGGIYITGNGSDDLESFDGHYNGQGIPVARTGGVHYDTKWNADKESINTNYKAGYLAVDGTRNTKVQNTIPGNLYNTNTDQAFNNALFRQKFDLTYNVKLDTTANLKLSVDGTLKNNKTASNNATVSQRVDSTLLNTNNRRLTNNTDAQVFNASALWTKKLKKKGRTVSVNISEAYNGSDSKGYLNSETDYFNTVSKLDSTRKIDQYKTSNIKSSVLNGNVTYSEPLSKSFSVIANYGIGVNNGSADRKSFDQSVPGRYDKLNDTLSNNFQLNQLTNQLGAVFNYLKGKTVFNFGNKITHVNFDQLNVYTNTDYKRTFINWNPQAMYQYKFSQYRSFRFNYTGSSHQPGIDQIQPVKVNTDPLNLTVGNPDLKPSFRNNFNVNYNSYKVLSGQSVYISGSYSFTNNQIVNNTTYNAGTSTTQAVNLVGKTPYNFSIYSSLGRKIKPFDINTQLNLQANGGKSYSYSNGQLNATNTLTYSINLSFNKYQEKKYDYYFSFGPNITKSSNSLQSLANNNGAGANGYGSVNVYLPGKLQLGSDVDYTYRAKTQSFDTDFSRVLLNASVSKKFLKDESFKVVVSGNDLLNQNVGFSRSQNANAITQSSYTTIKRYFMLSLVWDFSKMGGAVAPKK